MRTSLESLARSDVGVPDDDASNNFSSIVQMCPQVSCTFASSSNFSDVCPHMIQRKPRIWSTHVLAGVTRIRHVVLFSQRVVDVKLEDANVVPVVVVGAMMVVIETDYGTDVVRAIN